MKPSFNKVPAVALLLAVFFVGLAPGCTSTEDLLGEWNRGVEEGTYGWMNFNTGDYRNLDLPPQPEGGALATDSRVNQSARCLARIIEYNRQLDVVVRFLIDREGKPTDHVAINAEAGACGADAVRALAGMRFEPGYRAGRRIPVVGEYTVHFRHKWKN